MELATVDEIFLVPIGPDPAGDGMLYEAVFGLGFTMMSTDDTFRSARPLGPGVSRRPSPCRAVASRVASRHA